MNYNILPFLGLALRGGRLAVGEEPTALAALSGQARLVLTASDASGNTLRRAQHLAEEGHCLCLTLPFSKSELGGAFGRSSAAIAALTDTGLAAAVTERLAAMDPERYGESAARMDLKLRRAKERKATREKAQKSPPSPRRKGASPGSKSGRRDSRPWDRPPDSGRKPRQGGESRQSGPGRRDPQGGKGRPYGERSGENRHTGKPGRPHRETPSGPRNGKRPGIPSRNRGGPRSGGSSHHGGGR